MFYRKGWTQKQYDEANGDKDKIRYTVVQDLMLVPEVIVTAGTQVSFSPAKQVVWIERASVSTDDIVPLTKKQVQQLIDEHYFEKR
jgi:hypothetical protein